MTNQMLIEIIKSEMAEQLKYNSLDKLSHSPYYVEHIMHRIGTIAFECGYRLTSQDQDEILIAVFSV